jgi:hypothetical protein
MPLQKLAYASTLALVIGCGSSMQPFQPGGGTTRDLSATPVDLSPGADLAGSNGDGGGVVAHIDMAGFNLPGSPTVVINSPMSTTEVQYDLLTVTATVTSPMMTPIQSSMVLLSITPPNGGIVSVPMSLSAVANVYSGSIDISAIPSGPGTFSVSAIDTMGRKGSANGSYIHDHGPVITFLQPTMATAHASVTVELLVNDTLHPVTDPTAVSAYIRKAGDITLKQEMGATPMRLSALVDFSKFTPPLDGQQLITATATNPNGTTTHATKQFIVDNSGPKIVIMTPPPDKFVGGVTLVQAMIDDDYSGVSDVSVLAVFGNDPMHNAVPLTRMAPGSDVFQGYFDVRSLGRDYVLPELSVTAADTLGNSSQLGEEIIVDNTPPRITMDAKIQMYVSQPVAGGAHECSHPFSPLGPFTPDPPEVVYDGALVQQVFGVRARIEDHGNFAPGLAVERYSGVSKPSVFLYAIPDNRMTPLAVDTDGNGVCDNVNPLLIPSSTGVTSPGQAFSLQLVPLTAGPGTADFRGPFTAPSNPAPIGQCDLFGDSGVTSPPNPLCTRGGTGLTIVIPYPDPNNLSPIWSIPPVDASGTGFNCVGYQLDSANLLPEGPTCIVTVATDNTGNTNVSAPLHICIDRHSGGSLPGSTDMASNPCAGWNTSSPPTTCTGVFDKTQMKIVNGTCTPEPSFVSGEVRYLPAFKQ